MAQPSAAHAGLRDRNVLQLEPTSTQSAIRRRAAQLLIVCLSRFMAAGIIVSLIVARRTPDRYLHLIPYSRASPKLRNRLAIGVGAYLLSLGQPGRKSP
jgi:hypothetical protein